MNTSIPVEIDRQLSSTCALLEQHLAGSLQAIHLFGSAVDGGLKPHSDIDLLVTVSARLTEPIRHSLMVDLLSVSAWPGTRTLYRPLEVTIVVRQDLIPWRYPPIREFQFGEWLREELQAGVIPPPALDPDLAILLTMARQHSVCLTGAPVTDLFDPVPQNDFVKALSDTIEQWNDESDWQGDERNVILALARIWFSLFNGVITSKDGAAEWVLERLPHEYRPVLASALAAYLDDARDDLTDRAEEVATFVRCCKTIIKNSCLNNPSKR